MSEITLAHALNADSFPIAGRVLDVETNAKGDGSKPAEVLRVEVKEIKVVQPGNPNVIVQEILTVDSIGRGFNFFRSIRKSSSGRVLSLGGNTKVK